MEPNEMWNSMASLRRASVGDFLDGRFARHRWISVLDGLGRGERGREMEQDEAVRGGCFIAENRMAFDIADIAGIALDGRGGDAEDFMLRHLRTHLISEFLRYGLGEPFRGASPRWASREAEGFP